MGKSKITQKLVVDGSGARPEMGIGFKETDVVATIDGQSRVERRGASLQISGLGVDFGGLTVLDGIDAVIQPGTFFTLLGSSGSGKSTLLMAIAGFVTPQRGSILLNDARLNDVPIHRRNIGMVFQSYALFPNMTAAQNIGYPLRLRRRPRAEIDRRVESALILVQMEGFGKRDVATLSGGQRQRVALARAIVFEPDVLLMDEPLSALDKQLREAMQIEIRRLHNRLGLTTIYVTHDQREAMTLSDEIAILDGGRIVQCAPPDTLYNQPVSAMVANFMGESSLLPVMRNAVGRFCHHGRPILSSHALPDSSEAWLVIRPEKLIIAERHDDIPANRFLARLTDRIFQGESWLFDLVLEGGDPVKARAVDHGTASLSKLPIGSEVVLGLSATDAYLIPRQS